ncbi:hypothetical protein D3C75_1292910 [compost metagenome]
MRRAGGYQGQRALLWVLHQRPWASGEGNLFDVLVRRLYQTCQRRGHHCQGEGIAQNTSTAKVAGAYKPELHAALPVMAFLKGN